jgi:two-component system, OmpR family, sensor histidine kinase VicK
MAEKEDDLGKPRNTDALHHDPINQQIQGTTIIIKGRKRALQEAYKRSLTSLHDYYCITGDELEKSYKPFIPLLQARVNQRSGSTQILTNIEKGTILAVKELTEAGAQVKHVDSSSLRRCVVYDDDAAYFSIVEEPLITQTAIDNVDQTEGEDLWVASTEHSVIQSAKNQFLSDWENAIQPKDRINQLETGIEPEFYKVITNGEKASQIIVDLTKSIKKEALFFLPNDKSLLRADNLGTIDCLIMASQQGATIKIICPLSEQNSGIVRKISENAPRIRLLNGNSSPYGMYIIDGEKFFRAEIRQPMADKFSEAVGLAVYSNRKTTVDSFKSVFELLWNERALVEELKRADKMQKEFINVAAHELRTPIQPILILIDILLTDSKKGNITHHEEMLNVIHRNAKRLQRVTENILDVTKIESDSLDLKKDTFDLNETIMSVLAEYGNQVRKLNQVEITFTSKDDCIVQADKLRIAQVISNLLNNAIKFTLEGTIVISSEKIKNDNKKPVAMFCIKDTGIGIHPEVHPKLFSKFASKSVGGIGLGLYLCKSIIEAHGGRIWAENNADGKGTTFFFTLPLPNEINIEYDNKS